MKFFTIKSNRSVINLDKVSEIQFKDDCIMVWYNGYDDSVRYKLTDKELATLMRFLCNNKIEYEENA